MGVAMKPGIRLGIIGCGGMARAHVTRMRGVLEKVEVTAVVDIDAEKAGAVAEFFPERPVVHRDYGEVLDLVDAVLVVLPHHLHHPVTVRCLDAGKHVLVEKPMANTERECLEMIEAARRNDRVLMVAYCCRFHPLLLKLKEILDSRTFGEVFQLSIWTEQYTEHSPNHWANKAETLGGGQFFSHGCHYIDLMLWMLGRPVKGTHMGTNRCTPWMEKEGTSNVCLKFEDGTLGYHFGTWGARGTRLGYSFHAHCEKGMVEAHFGRGQVVYLGDVEKHVPGVHDPGQKEVILLEAENSKPTEEEMIHFVECIETGRKPLTDGVSSLEGLQVIWKLYEAERNNVVADLQGLGLGSMDLDRKGEIR